MKIINTATKLVGLLGHPISKSLSPMAHNDVYEKLGINGLYLPIELSENESIKPVLEGIRHMNFAGLAITTPYKEVIMEYLDDIDPTARMIGSCNTVKVMEGGKFKGYNTDGIGLLKALIHEGVEYKNSVFFVFGAGGTSKSVCYELAKKGAKKIYISSRSNTCVLLSKNINFYFPGICVPVLIKDMDITGKCILESDVLLNLSGVGMYPEINETPVDEKFFKPSHICFDAAYSPDKTLFLKQAESKGCKIMNGLVMLSYQGARQVSIWFGVEEPEQEMLESLNHSISVPLTMNRPTGSVR